MSYLEEQNKYVKEILAQKELSSGDYQVVWNNTTGYFTEDVNNFGQSNLKLLIAALDKIDFVPTSIQMSNQFPKSILLDPDLIECIKKFEEKMIYPISDLKGDEKKYETQSLIFAKVCGFNSSLYTILMYGKDQISEFEERNMQDSILEFLMDINKGNNVEKIRCIQAVDKLLDVYPETRRALTSIYDLKKDAPFSGLLQQVIAREDNKLSYLVDFEILLKNYQLYDELQTNLVNQEVKTTRPKI